MAHVPRAVNAEFFPIQGILTILADLHIPQVKRSLLRPPDAKLGQVRLLYGWRACLQRSRSVTSSLPQRKAFPMTRRSGSS